MNVWLKINKIIVNDKFVFLLNLNLVMYYSIFKAKKVPYYHFLIP